MLSKVAKKQDLQETAFNHSLDIDFKGFMDIYKKCTSKSYSFITTDTTLASDNPLCFRNNLLGRIQKLIIKIDDMIRDEKLQYNNNREEAKI